MPVFEIGLDDGRKLQIDAESEQAALAGVQHFITNSPPPGEPYSAERLGHAVKSAWDSPTPGGPLAMAKSIFSGIKGGGELTKDAVEGKVNLSSPEGIGRTTQSVLDLAGTPLTGGGTTAGMLAATRARAKALTSAAKETEAAVAAESGFVRFYHGGDEASREGGGSRWLTPDPEYAKGYAGKNGRVYYVDLPENSPYLKKSFDDTGTSQKAPYVSFEAPGEIANNLRPLKVGAAPPSGPNWADKTADFMNHPAWEVAHLIPGAGPAVSATRLAANGAQKAFGRGEAPPPVAPTINTFENQQTIMEAMPQIKRLALAEKAKAQAAAQAEKTAAQADKFQNQQTIMEALPLIKRFAATEASKQKAIRAFGGQLMNEIVPETNQYIAQKSFGRQAVPLLRRLAAIENNRPPPVTAIENNRPPPVEAPPPPEVTPPPPPAAAAAPAPVQPQVPPEPPQFNGVLPRDVVAATRALLKGRTEVDAMKARMTAPPPAPAATAPTVAAPTPPAAAPAPVQPAAPLPPPAVAQQALTKVNGKVVNGGGSPQEKLLDAYKAAQDKAEIVSSADDARSLELKTHTSSGMDPDEAAAHIADMMTALGKSVRNRDDFISYVSPFIQAKDQMATHLSRVLGVPADKLLPHVRAIATRAEAREWRTQFQEFEPERAGRVMDVMGDKLINKLWKK